MIFEKFRRDGTAACHSLHYFQMATEKLGKAYLWRTGTAPAANHVGFAQLMQGLGQVKGADERRRIANLFGFGRYKEFRSWIRLVMPIVHEVHKLAPACANDGPNPEYPWPHQQPTDTPAEYSFEIWQTLTKGSGRSLIIFVKDAIQNFPEFAAHH